MRHRALPALLLAATLPPAALAHSDMHSPRDSAHCDPFYSKYVEPDVYWAKHIPPARRR